LWRKAIIARTNVPRVRFRPQRWRVSPGVDFVFAIEMVAPLNYASRVESFAVIVMPSLYFICENTDA
jgi:hypothetical protein